MTPDQLAASGTESALQKAVMAWAALETKNYPELKWLHHVANGGARGKLAGARLKAEGVRRGVWDLDLPVTRPRVPGDNQWAGLRIEMKRANERNHKNGGLTDEQVEFGLFVSGQGYFTAVCYSWEEARDIILTYLKY